MGRNLMSDEIREPKETEKELLDRIFGAKVQEVFSPDELKDWIKTGQWTPGGAEGLAD